MPLLSARVRVAFDQPEGSGGSYAMRGSAEQVAEEARAFADLGVEHLALFFAESSAEGVVEAAERFAAEVAPLV
jgi:hypothetical protein